MYYDEQEIIELLGLCAQKFAAMDQVHPADTPEFVAAVHAAQNIVFARQPYREYINSQKGTYMRAQEVKAEVA